jgi:hypothetical protein
MPEVSASQAQAIAEYIYLTGFAKTATQGMMQDQIKKFIESQGYTYSADADAKWVNAEKTGFSQRLGTQDLQYLGVDIPAAQVNAFRKNQPLIIASGSKSAKPAGQKAKDWTGSIKTDGEAAIMSILTGSPAPSGIAEPVPTMEDEESKPAPVIDTPKPVTSPSSMPRLVHDRKIKKRIFPEDGLLPIGKSACIVTLKTSVSGGGERPLDSFIPRPLRSKVKNYTMPDLRLIIEEGKTLRYNFTNSNNLYDVLWDGNAVQVESGTVKIPQYEESPKNVESINIKLSQGLTLNLSTIAGFVTFFGDSLKAEEGFAFPSGKIAPLVLFPVPDLHEAVIDGTTYTFNATNWINDVSERSIWFPQSPSKQGDFVKGNDPNPYPWVSVYDKMGDIEWSADGLAENYLQPLPFDASKAEVLDLTKQYLKVEVEVDEATDAYTGYDWKAPNSKDEELFFPGDLRQLAPITRDSPEKEGDVMKIKGAARGNAITEIRFQNGRAMVTTSEGSFMIPDDSGDGTFYAQDTVSSKIDGERQMLRTRVQKVTIADYDGKASPDSNWTAIKAARRYKNLAMSVLPSSMGAGGAVQCSVCGLEVTGPCEMANCPMPTETEVGAGSVAYLTTQGGQEFLVLLVPDPDDRNNVYEIRMTVQK